MVWREDQCTMKVLDGMSWPSCNSLTQAPASQGRSRKVTLVSQDILDYHHMDTCRIIYLIHMCKCLKKLLCAQGKTSARSIMENLLDLVQVKVQAKTWREAGTKGAPCHCPLCHSTQTPPAALVMCPDMAAHGNDVTKEEEEEEEKRNKGLHLMLLCLLSDYC